MATAGAGSGLNKMRLQSLFRPRYILRAMLACACVLAIVVAAYRPLRHRLESFFGAKETFTHILIVGPQTSGTPAVLTPPPSPAEIIDAINDAGAEKLPPNPRFIIDPLSGYVDPPVSSPTGRYRLYHGHYKCTLILPNGTRTVYIDHNQRCVP